MGDRNLCRMSHVCDTTEAAFCRNNRAMTNAIAESRPASAAERSGWVIHPVWVRITHWINALAVIVMITSGWQIYNASPLFGFVFPPAITLGGWLAGALLWHFAAMWVLAVNGLIYFIM